MKAPYKVLYSNDTTNIETCISPYHKKGEPFRENMLTATVDETANTGVEVHMLQPGLGWIPFWKSKEYPIEKHIEFVAEKFGETPYDNGYAAYLADGGDMVKVFVERCRQQNLSPFVSLRLNDCHGHEVLEAFQKNGEKVGSWAWHALTPVHTEHPDWRIGKKLTGDWKNRALNWIIPEVRRQKIAFITELAEQYDIDGLELDFMRYCSFFDETQTTSEQRTEIITGFVREVRRILDRTAEPDQHRWLCIRVPCFTETFNYMGIDLKQMVDAGVDMVNISAYFFTEQQNDMAAIRQMIPDTSLYLEMCHCSQVGPLGNPGEYDEFTFRTVTPNQFYTTAHLAYSRGLDGVSVFNFVYYREHGINVELRGPFSEPPFEVFKYLGKPELLAKMPQHYILGKVWTHIWNLEREIPVTVSSGQTACIHLDMAPPTSGWTRGGKLRIQTEQELHGNPWTVVFNGLVLTETDDRSEPYGASRSFGCPAQYRAWLVPADILKSGINEIKIQLLDGGPYELIFLDVAVE